jgi:uncharacterized protein YneF (UPF0154 family)
MTTEVKNKFFEFAKIIGVIVPIVSLSWLIAQPLIENYIIKKVDEYEKAKPKIEETSLRELLSDKMGVPSDEVHIKIGEMYRNQGNEEIKRLINEIINEIHYYHDDSILQMTK